MNYLKKKFFLFLKRHLEIETGIDEAKNKQKKNAVFKEKPANNYSCNFHVYKKVLIDAEFFRSFFQKEVKVFLACDEVVA